jgi:rRNA-processing protein FCF1
LIVGKAGRSGDFATLKADIGTIAAAGRVRRSSDAMVRVLIDTNVWRYVVDADQVEALRKLGKARDIRVLVAPAVVYEMLRTGDAALRTRLVKAVTLGVWERLMTEAYEVGLTRLDGQGRCVDHAAWAAAVSWLRVAS